MEPDTLWGNLLVRAGVERNRVRDGRTTVSRDEAKEEMTPFGRLRWYLHGDLEEPVTRALYFCELEIPAGSRSGKLHHQGGIVHLVVQGMGYTEYEGERQQW